MHHQQHHHHFRPRALISLERLRRKGSLRSSRNLIRFTKPLVAFCGIKRIIQEGSWRGHKLGGDGQKGHRNNKMKGFPQWGINLNRLGHRQEEGETWEVLQHHLSVEKVLCTFLTLLLIEIYVPRLQRPRTSVTIARWHHLKTESDSHIST